MQSSTMMYILWDYGFMTLIYLIGLSFSLYLLYKKIIKKIPFHETLWKLKMLGKTTKKSWKIHERKFVIGMIIIMLFWCIFTMLISGPFILDFYNIITGNYETMSCVATTDGYYYDGSRYSNGRYIIDCENNKKIISIDYVTGDVDIKKGTSIYVKYFKHIGVGEVYKQ